MTDEWLVIFMDGTLHTVAANRAEVEGDVLHMWTEWHGARDWHHFPLVNVRSWTKVKR